MTAFLTRVWFVSLSAILCLASPASFAEEIRISVLDFCPLHCKGPDGKLRSDQPGAVVEIYRKIYGDAGYQTRFRHFPFNRGMLEVSLGRVDAISLPLKFTGAALQDKIRQLPEIGRLYGRLIYTERPIGTHQSSCFFVRSNSEWVYDDEGSLESQRIGVANDHDYGPEMNAYLEKARLGGNSDLIRELSGANMFLRNLKMLVARRLDIVLIDRVSGSYTIKQAEKDGEVPAGSIKLSGCIGSAQELFLGFSDKTPERSRKLARIFDDGIVRMRRSGELKSLLDKYGLDDWVKK